MLKIVRSNGKWFINCPDGSQAVHEFFNTLEEARETREAKKAVEAKKRKEVKIGRSTEEYVEKLEIVPPIKKAEIRHSKKK